MLFLGGGGEEGISGLFKCLQGAWIIFAIKRKLDLHKLKLAGEKYYLWRNDVGGLQESCRQAWEK